MASKESRGLLTAVVALVAFAVMMVWVMVGPSDGADEPVVEPEAPVEPVAAPEPAQPAPKPAAQPVAEPTPEPSGDNMLDGEAVDLFAGDMPDFMAEYHLRVLQKKKLGVHQQKQLYDWGQEHKDDARPQLILAWDSMNRDWEGLAVRMYRIAYRADNRAKYDPTMLRDLLTIAGKYDRTEYRETVGIIEEAYGQEALPRVDAELAKHEAQGNAKAVDRLQRLRDTLLGKGD